MLPLTLALPSLAPLVALPAPQASAPAPGTLALGGVDVPLARLPGVPSWLSAGASFLDYDADGWIDLFVKSNAGLWRNEGGTSFSRVADLDVFLPPIAARYGSACGDYDNDGLADIACSPRGDCFYLLRNLDGAGSFVEVASDPAVLAQPLSCAMFGESFAWCDVDVDGDLDLWITAYPTTSTPGAAATSSWRTSAPRGREARAASRSARPRAGSACRGRCR
jgi:hypothetical protein